MVTTRYLVRWIPEADVERACARRGLFLTDQSFSWDLIDVEPYAKRRPFQSFAEAKDFAERVTEADVFQAPLIERQRLTVEDHGLLHMPVWQRSGWWEIGHGELVADTPHFADPE